MPLTMHMIHPRVSLSTPAASMVDHSRPQASKCEKSLTVIRSCACSSRSVDRESDLTRSRNEFESEQTGRSGEVAVM